jgi:hypothetical protein
MNELNRKLGFLTEWVKEKPRIGKTVVMKCLYLMSII